MAMIKQYQKKNGEKAWYFKTYLGIDPLTGKKRYTTKRGFKTQKEAKIALARLEVLATDKKLVKDNNYTFTQVKDMWIEQYKPTVRESTYLRVKFLFDKNISTFFGNKKIQSYNIAYCQEAINKWKEQYSTYKALKCYTSAVFDYAKKMNLINENPMKAVTFSKGERKQKKNKLKYFEKEELQDFLECCQKDKFPITYPLFRVLAFTGIRKGEALALTWDDVDFFNKTLEINKTITKTSDNKFISTPPKTNTSIRKISLDDETLNILKSWKTQQKRYLLAHGQHAKTKNQIIFSSKNNNYIDITRPNIILSRICKKHNFNDITIHGFRHTHCSLLFEAGLSIKEVQERLGHSDIHTTMNIYTHVTKKQKERSADKFAAYLNF
ncbi:site-specific integrase [Enterococcus faecium]|uniref:site-specific integrase n=1 Tax=Enterococcus faecium TaxID=1352 RepID=UPI001912F474|nr:site-specific integrase [Enterococcus faecium]MBK5028080.1 site-specific integrase [Enterococcus faecium]MBK5038824.1 site-specific integrase [Enterococcus faecium]MBK5043897.1 site-specific integrase [Enterococcus faecium]MBK5068819.1 site-specific integrase [Enterococcus faecium]MBK5132111.1 site-specific integrase [Enterococcus faecium]